MQIGLLDESEELHGGSHRALSGVEFDELGPDGQAQAVATMALFSRVEPSHKTALVDLLRAHVRNAAKLLLLQLCTVQQPRTNEHTCLDLQNLPVFAGTRAWLQKHTDLPGV